MLLNNQCITEEVKLKIKKQNTKTKTRDKWQQKTEDPKLMWCSKVSSKREVYNNAVLLQEIRNISNT